MLGTGPWCGWSWFWMRLRYQLSGFRNGCDRAQFHPTMCMCVYDRKLGRWIPKRERQARAKAAKS